MKFVKVDPSFLDSFRSVLEAHPEIFPAAVVFGGIVGAWMFASWSSRRF